VAKQVTNRLYAVMATCNEAVLAPLQAGNGRIFIVVMTYGQVPLKFLKANGSDA